MHKQPAAGPFPLPRNDFFIKIIHFPNKPSHDCKPSAYFHIYLGNLFFRLHSFIVLLTIGFVLKVSLVLAAAGMLKCVVN